MKYKIATWFLIVAFAGTVFWFAINPVHTGLFVKEEGKEYEIVCDRIVPLIRWQCYWNVDNNKGEWEYFITPAIIDRVPISN